MTKLFRFLPMVLLVTVISLSSSCKKVVDNSGGGNGGSDTYLGNYTLSNSMYDTLYMYAKAFYLWNNDLPNFENFDPMQYRIGDSLSGLSRELFELTQIPINPETNKPYEYPISPEDFPFDSKYSYMLKTADNSNGGNTEFIIQPNTKSFTLDGKGNDMGVHFGFIGTEGAEGQDTVYTLLKYIENGSPAQKAGLKRGDIIYKMNNVAKDFLSFGSDNERNNYYNDLVDGNSLDIVRVDSLYPKSGHRKEYNYNIKKAVYTLNPVLKDTVINLPGGKKVAYLALESFTEMKNAKSKIDAAFKKFSGVTDLIVDLRYNGGGSVETSEYLADYIVPTGKDGQTLFAMDYNDSLRRDAYSEQSNYSENLKNVLKSQTLLNDDGSVDGTCLDLDYSVAGNTEKVMKTGNLELTDNQVFFIVGGGTASASELLINSLATHNRVTTVGALYAEDIDSSRGDYAIRTYGKPVGFFDLRVGDYTVYMSMFKSLNSEGEGDYYDGMLTDGLGSDDIESDFGRSKDPTSALNLILRTLDDKFNVSGAKASLSMHSTLLRQELGKRIRLNRAIRGFEKAEIRRSFKPMVRKKIELQ